MSKSLESIVIDERASTQVAQQICGPSLCRLPCSDMKLIGAVKGLVHDFWHENTRPSSNQKYVLKLRRGYRDRESHIKHFLDITQTKLCERFKAVHSALNLGQIFFHKCKPLYVRINTIHNTCCRYHIDYGYYYHTHTHTHTHIYIYIYFMFCVTPFCMNA
jgi:hypothetical protein